MVTTERERRKQDEDRKALEDRSSKLEGELRLITRERDRLRDESESARQKNRDNLAQTQARWVTFEFGGYFEKVSF